MFLNLTSYAFGLILSAKVCSIFMQYSMIMREVILLNLLSYMICHVQLQYAYVQVNYTRTYIVTVTNGRRLISLALYLICSYMYMHDT